MLFHNFRDSFEVRCRHPYCVIVMNVGTQGTQVARAPHISQICI